MSGSHSTVARAGFAAALLGTAAGAAEVALGTSPWVGNKNDPTTLGLVTVFLALVIGTSGGVWRWVTTTLGAVGVAAAMLVPALVGTTTAGVAWLPAGAVAAVGGISALRQGAKIGSISHPLRDQWPSILLGFLALIYVALGVVARGGTGVLAVAGGLAVIATLPLRRRSHAAAALLLVAGALPFAVVAWWSVVAPITGALMLMIGLPMVLRKIPGEPAPRSPGAPDTARVGS